MKNACKRVLVLAVAAIWASLQSVSGSQQAKPLSPAETEFFEKKIRPVLTSHCFTCHSSGSKQLRGNLLLDSREGILKGGSSGRPAVVPGDPDQSPLIQAIRYVDSKLQMPPGGQLTPAEIRDFEEWVKMGAPDPRLVALAPASKAYDFDKAKNFWSFRAVTDPRPPRVTNRTWVRNPIDRFILAKLEEKNLHPVADADRRTLIRRVTFDLIGLPPTPEEVASFLADRSPDAFSKVVDRLLASPQYGERWGRHWLDVVRYADTAGDNSDFPVPSAYRYRNYVIRSFNEDKPYDQFIREQIAGDLLPATSDADKNEKIVATGYLAISRRFGSRNKEFNLTIDDTIDNVGKAFLGLSVSCARCHDHKFDPIPTRDYYALYGIFNSSRFAFAGAEIYPHPADMVPLVSGKQAETFDKWQKTLSDLDDRKEQLVTEVGVAGRNKAQKEKLAKELAEKAAGNQDVPPGQPQAKTEKVESVTGSDEARPADFDRDARNSALSSKSRRMPEEVEAETKEVRAKIAELNQNAPKVDKAYAVVDGRVANARLHRKGDPKSLGDEVPRGFLTILGGQQVPDGNQSSGRDYLARWITDPANPLTARVIVNRMWEYHFGKGIVATPNDFGARGQAPTHPELLDFLASRLIESKWSMKAIHRLIVTSRAYQLSSSSDKQNAVIDVGNSYLWRFDRRRLSAEEIRDALLAVSGQLDTTVGLAHPFAPEREWKYTQHNQFFGVYETKRRSVYLMQQRLKKHPLMEVFDGPDTNSSTPYRSATVTPVQALYLMNDPFVHEQADLFAVRVGMAVEGLPERIDFAYKQALGRHATPQEQQLAVVYLKKMRMDLKETNLKEEEYTRKALASLFRVIFSSNEFLYVD